jgi:hypothetical protein
MLLICASTKGSSYTKLLLSVGYVIVCFNIFLKNLLFVCLGCTRLILSAVMSKFHTVKMCCNCWHTKKSCIICSYIHNVPTYQICSYIHNVPTYQICSYIHNVPTYQICSYIHQVPMYQMCSYIHMDLYGAETWTLRAVDQKHLESSEIWCWKRMEKISWTDHVRNKDVLLRVKEQRNILHEIRKRKVNCIGHILRRNCLLQRVIEGKIQGGG